MIKIGDLLYDDEWGILTVIGIDINDTGWLVVTRKNRLGQYNIQEEITTRLTPLDLYLLNGDV